MTRKNKHEPQEISSKQPVGVLRENFQRARPKAIDPRFDRAFGAFHEDEFKKVYSFVKDVQQSERQTLATAYERERNPTRAAAIKRALDRQQSVESAMKRDEFRRDVMKKWKKTEQEMVGQGKAPFFLKKSDQKRLELVAKYKEMKENHKGQSLNIDRLVEKRRKHKAAKQRTQLPFATPRDE